MADVATFMRVAAVVLVAAAMALSAAPRPDRWIAILNDPPAARAERADRASAAARLGVRQRTLESQIAKRKGVRVLGRSQRLINAVYFSGTREDAAAVRQMSGVQRVAKQRYYKRQDIKAAEQVRAVFAWDAVGGEENAGKGMRIAVLDSGIDTQHPSLVDPSLEMPSGFPKCDEGFCDGYTSPKVIAARSFIRTQAIPDDPTYSRPDDYSPRDRVGHGTAVASLAAGIRTDGPAGTLQGVAPKALLGNYKIFGSPGVNDFVSDQTLIEALEAAYADGMDIAVIAVGAPALWSVDDFGGICDLGAGMACDAQVDIVEQAVEAGMIVVTDAGNTGDTGLHPPGLGTINTPGTAPSAITVGAMSNTHRYFATVRAKGGAKEVPAHLAEINAALSNGLRPDKPLSRRVVDVATLQDTRQACEELPAGALDGAIALIQRGGCEFVLKLGFAQKAGAVAAVIYQIDGNDLLFPIDFVREAGIPAVMISNTDGKALKEWIASHSEDAQVEIDPALRELDSSDTANQVSYFSSRGPSIGRLAIKPDLVAVGSGLYVATQSYDPNGDMYSADGYTAVQGTSFAAAQVAGAAALVWQKYPDMTPQAVRSVLVNTANNEVSEVGADGAVALARNVAIGAGKLDVENALRSTVTVSPETLSFGIPENSGYPSGSIRFSNWGPTAVTLSFEVQARDADSRSGVQLSASTLTLQSRQAGTVQVRVGGTVPNAGAYEGAILVRGGGTTLRIPYLYLMYSDIPYNIVPLTGDSFVAEPGTRVDLNFLSADRFGIPTVDSVIDARAGEGGGRIERKSSATDLYGIGLGVAFTGDSVGYQEFVVDIGSGSNKVSYLFTGRNRATPVIAEEGGVSSAIGGGTTIAAGSLVRIRGSALAEATLSRFTPYLPLSLANVSVSFDDTANKTSYPGRVVRVSPEEVVVQAPWELEGLESVQLKVSIGYTSQSALATVGVSRFSPAFFETGDGLAVATDAEGVAITAEHGAVAGQEIHFDVSGLGPVNNRPASGEAAPGRDSTTHGVPEVTIGGQKAEVSYTGLKPGSPAVYQVSVIVPADLTGGTYPVTLSIDGISANASKTVIR